MKTPISLFFLLITFLILVIPAQANPALALTVKTDKQEYYATESVYIYGNLTLDETLVTDGLVGLQLQTSEDKILTIRTLSTGTLPSTTPYVKLWYVVPCNSSGGPKFSFKRGTLAYFKIVVTNFDIVEPRYVCMTINTYYSDNTPFGFAALQTTLSPNSTSPFTISIPIPSDSVLGAANVYANAYTDWPKQGGTPHCSEKQATFEIVDDEASSQTTQEIFTETNETGNFNLTLTLPRKSLPGNYTIYVTSKYVGDETFNSTTFRVNLLGDLGSGPPPTFFAFDGIVDSWDYALWKACYDGLGP